MSSGTTAPVLVVGAGLAGLMTALRLAPWPCTVVTAGELGEDAASGWAQGGLAAALGPGDDPARHAADTLAAADGLADRRVAELVCRQAPAAVALLLDLGVRLDRDGSGRPQLALEGAHSRARVVHARGDGTGAELVRAAVAAVRRTPSVRVLPRARALRLVTDEEGVRGLVVSRRPGRAELLSSRRVVLATGGSAALWEGTTNPRGALGAGLAMAARAGAVLRDLELVQFHPTAMAVGADPLPLVSEAVRGAGARLVDEQGRPLTDDDMAGRDVVARAVWRHLQAGGRAYLDARRLPPGLLAGFPGLTGRAEAAGLDPATDLLPVRPAAHYHCGGVAVDGRGRTSVPGLWACGEVASTGLHGANRLASNSLLEAVVVAGWAAADLRGPHPAPPPHRGRGRGEDPAPVERPGSAGPVPCPDLPRLRAMVAGALGVVRDGPSLRAALRPWLERVRRLGPDTVDDPTLVAALVASSALAREESRGGHYRSDHPSRAPGPARSTQITLPGLLGEQAGAVEHRSA